jgi:uncharacterized membrane protein YagU involved in acid resistance
MTGNWTIALLGLLIHFLIAFTWTIFFFIVQPKLPKGNWIIYGLLYGIIVWIAMNIVVLPMTRVTMRPFTWSGMVTGMIVLMLAIGLPVSYHAHKFYKR